VGHIPTLGDSRYSLPRRDKGAPTAGRPEPQAAFADLAAALSTFFASLLAKSSLV
jgi:hypothetical protein